MAFWADMQSFVLGALSRDSNVPGGDSDHRFLLKTNFFALVVIVVALLVAAGQAIAYYFYFPNTTGGDYLSLRYYGGLPLVAILVTVGAYTLRGFHLIGLETLAWLNIGGAAAVLATYSIFLGATPQFYLLIFVLVPVPFLAVDYNRYGFGWVGAGALVGVLLISAAISYALGPIVPVPPQVEVYIRQASICIFVIAGALYGYYFWYRENGAQYRLRLHSQELRKKSSGFENDLKLAAGIQTASLPGEFQQWQSLQIWGRYGSASPVQASFFDASEGPTGSFYLLSAEVSCRGLPAALFSLMARQIINPMFGRGESPEAILRRAHSFLLAAIDTDDFIRLCIFRIFSNGQMQYANAGHPGPVYYSAQNNKYYELPHSESVIGSVLTDGDAFAQSKMQLHPGDRFHIFTQGFLRRENKRRNAFGYRRFVRSVKKFGLGPAEESYRGLIKNWNRYCGETDPEDYTFLTMQWA